MATYTVTPSGVARAERLIDARQYVLDSDWGDVQPSAADENGYLEAHGWETYADWHLGLTHGAVDGTKARCAFVFGDSAASTARVGQVGHVPQRDRLALLVREHGGPRPHVAGGLWVIPDRGLLQLVGGSRSAAATLAAAH